MSMNQHKEAFKEEARELLTELESTLLELEETPDDIELIGNAFRKMHTIKGSGAMFGFEDIASFTHDMETVFDLLREGKIKVTKELIDLSLSASDEIRQMIEGLAAEEAQAEEIVRRFRDIIPRTVDSEAPPILSAEEPADSGSGSATYRIRFKPASEIFANGTNPILLLDELRDLGECRVIAHTGDIPSLSELNAESCFMFWDVILTTGHGINAVKDVFIFVEDDCELNIEVIDEQGLVDTWADYKKLGEILVERGDVSAEDLKQALGKQKRVGELLVEEKTIDQKTVESALAEQQHVKQIKKTYHEAAAASNIRVHAKKLDRLVDLVGELVTVQARFSQKASSKNDPELLSMAEEVERLTAELRDNTMDIRMLPIGTTFARFRRLVRDLSAELGKEIVLETEGGETELDKTVIERLNDPLVHLIRNCIDHGIESPEGRKAAGKPDRGTIRLTAAHRGANVIITIADDGQGLDAENIRARAVEKDLIAPDADLSENEIFEQIFASGFSTAKMITDISGRGVGMDVVKRGIEALRGNVGISSRKGSGTEITLKLPLTLAIIDGLLVELDNAFYVIPLFAVEECVELSRDDKAKSHGRNMLNMRNKIVPYIPLRKLFGIKEDPLETEHIVIAEVEGNRFGIVVDRVIGGHQTVIKTLGKVYKDAKGVSGATILADGTVALVLDVHRLIEVSQME